MLYILILLCINMFSCSSDKESKGTITYVYVDLTEIEENDNHYDNVQSGIGYILEQMNLDTLQGGDGFGRVFIFPIYDFSFSRPRIISLERNTRFVNRLTRISEVKEFHTYLQNAFQSVIAEHLIDTLTQTHNKSYIFRPLCEGIKKLAKYDHTFNKQIIVFSDMLENSDLFSFYHDIDAIRNHPDQLIKKLKKEFDFPVLSDISINIIYQPRKEKDFLLVESKEFWTKFFLGDVSKGNIKYFSFDTYLQPSPLTNN